jgi:hypothetical protein
MECDKNTALSKSYSQNKIYINWLPILAFYRSRSLIGPGEKNEKTKKKRRAFVLEALSLRPQGQGNLLSPPYRHIVRAGLLLRTRMRPS